MHAHPRPAGRAGDFHDVHARARAAVEAARETVAHSHVLAEVIRLEREGDGLLIRCAWCGRYSLGGEWTTEAELPPASIVEEKLDGDRITHSICPDCSNVP